MDDTGLANIDCKDKYENEAFRKRKMPKEEALIKSEKQSCIEGRQIIDGFALLL